MYEYWRKEWGYGWLELRILAVQHAMFLSILTIVYLCFQGEREG
jgi:hypothetical protein